MNTNKLINLLLILTILITNLKIFACDLNLKFIQSYIEHKFIKYALLYSCSTKQDNLKNLKHINTSIPLKYINSKSFQQKNYDLESVFNNSILNGIFIDADCLETTELIYVLPQINVCTTINPCAVIHSMTFFDKAVNLTFNEYIFNYLNKNFQNLPVNLDADLKFVFPYDKLKTSYNLFDVYKVSVKYSTPLIINYIGTWNVDYNFGFVQKQLGTIYTERRDWRGIEFKSMSVLTVPFEGTVENHIRSDEHLEINHFNRLVCLYMMYCGDYYNFSIKVSKTESWGYQLSNGSFDGIVGGFQSNSIDFGCSPIFLVKDRMSLVDYGFRVWRLKSAFLFRHPKAKATFEVFFLPLDKFVWFLILISLGLIILEMKCIIYYEYIRLTNQNVDASWSSVVLFLIGAICQQGTTSVPVFISGRILTFFVFVFAILIYQFYSASLVSSLLLQPPLTIKNVYDLANSDLKIGSEDVLYAKKHFKRIASDKHLRKLQQKTFPNTPFFLTPGEGLKLVDDGNFAFNVDLATAYPIIRKSFHEAGICEMEEVVLYDYNPVYSCHPKGSKLKKPFDILLEKVSERGLLHRMQLKYHARKPTCIKSFVVASAVGLEQFYPALVIWSVGILLSLIILVFECVVDKFIRRNKTNLDLEVLVQTEIYPFTN